MSMTASTPSANELEWFYKGFRQSAHPGGVPYSEKKGYASNQRRFIQKWCIKSDSKDIYNVSKNHCPFELVFNQKNLISFSQKILSSTTVLKLIIIKKCFLSSILNCNNIPQYYSFKCILLNKCSCWTLYYITYKKKIKNLTHPKLLHIIIYYKMSSELTNLKHKFECFPCVFFLLPPGAVNNHLTRALILSHGLSTLQNPTCHLKNLIWAADESLPFSDWRHVIDDSISQQDGRNLLNGGQRLKATLRMLAVIAMSLHPRRGRLWQLCR